MRAQAAIMERTMAEQERQFELSRTTVESINRRCHDMRHQVLRLIDEGYGDGRLPQERLRQIAREINVYDTAVRTGNAALDVAITQAGLLARQDGATIACIADGSALDGMAPADVYSLFECLLGSALEEVHALGLERRTISLDLRCRMGMASATIEHDAPGEGVSPAIPPTAYDIVSRLGGTITATTTDGVSTVNVLLPL